MSKQETSFKIEKKHLVYVNSDEKEHLYTAIYITHWWLFVTGRSYLWEKSHSYLILNNIDPSNEWDKLSFTRSYIWHDNFLLDFNKKITDWQWIDEKSTIFIYNRYIFLYYVPEELIGKSSFFLALLFCSFLNLWLYYDPVGILWLFHLSNMYWIMIH